MTLIQENKNVEKISLVKPTEARGGGGGGGHILISFVVFLIFTSPFSFSVFISYFSVSAFNVLIFTFPFFFSVEISLLIFFFTLSSFFSEFSIFTDLFRFTFQFLINYIMKTNTKT